MSVTRHNHGSQRRPEGFAYLFLVPTLVLFTGAIMLPATAGIFYSFTNSGGFGEWNFIGLSNYVAALNDPSIRSSYGFTIIFATVTTIVVNIIAFMLALGLTANIRFKMLLRAIYVIPMVISGIIIAYVFQFIFSNAVPALGQHLGIDVLSSSLLANQKWAWLVVVLVTAWQATPAVMLVYIAGLLAIPREVYEASTIDGADGIRQLTRITLPLVAHYIVINLIISLKNFLNTYDVIVGLTNGGPGTATRSVAMTIFKGFEGGDYAYQMANATIFFLFAITLAVLQLRISGGRVDLQ